MKTRYTSPKRSEIDGMPVEEASKFGDKKIREDDVKIWQSSSYMKWVDELWPLNRGRDWEQCAFAGTTKGTRH